MSVSTSAEAAASCSFNDLALAPFLQETIKSVGYETPTPIQAQAIPLVIEGGDVIGLAQTGTGKTAAFVLPLLNRLSGSKERGVRALILAPTRELAEQINDVIKTFAPRTGLKSCTIYGGVSHRNQVMALRSNPAIVVACPGRLKDHMQGESIDLSKIEMLVLDEADRMLDMGFLPDIKQIVRAIPAERQTLLFSATMPDEIQELTKQILKDPTIIKVKTEAPVATVSHAMYSVKNEDKLDNLRNWLTANPQALTVVFTKMKHTAKRISERLSKQGIDATSLHGNLSQGQRSKALGGFKDGTYRVLIATDIAARGIDVDGITHVLNYDMPDTLDAYIHRTGRAGRASRSGEAISFVTRGDMGMLRSIERWLKAPVARLNTGAVEATVEGAEGEELEESSARTPRRQPREGRGNRGDRRQGSGRGERQSRGRGGDRRDGRRDGRGERGFGGRSERPGRPQRSFEPTEAPTESHNEAHESADDSIGNRAGAAERMSFVGEYTERRSNRGRPRGGRTGGGRFGGNRGDKRGGRSFGRRNDGPQGSRFEDRGERSARGERAERGERGDRPAWRDRPERSEGFGRGQRPERGGRFGRGRSSDRPSGPSRDGQGDFKPARERSSDRGESRFGERSEGRFGGGERGQGGPRRNSRPGRPGQRGPRQGGPRQGGLRGPRGSSRAPRMTHYD